MALLVKWLDGYSFRVCRVWERLLVVEIVAIQPLLGPQEYWQLKWAHVG